MFEIMEESSGALVGVKASGVLTDADYKDHLIPFLEETFARHGKLRILCLMDESFEGWDLHAAWDDASFGIRHRADFEKLAVVGGPEWVKWCMRFGAVLMKGEVAVFPRDRLEEAWGWVKS